MVTSTRSVWFKAAVLAVVLCGYVGGVVDGGLARGAYEGVHPQALFVTPGHAAYCSVQATSQDDASPSLFCWTPDDGFGVSAPWRAAAVSTDYYTKPPAIVHGTAVLKGYRPAAPLLAFGKRWLLLCDHPKTSNQCDGIVTSAAKTSKPQIVCNDLRTLAAGTQAVPRRCTVLPPSASFSEGVNLAELSWSGWGGATATARGFELGFHLPLSHIPVAVRADLRTVTRCGVVYSRLRVTSRYGTTVVRPESCGWNRTMAFTCSSAAPGLTCDNAVRHGFWVGRYRGFRRH